jgi:hypothetical protein
MSLGTLIADTRKAIADDVAKAPRRERFVYQATLDAIDFIQGRAKGDTLV